MSIIDRILAIFAPNDCLGCRAEGNLLCNECIASLPAVAPKELNNPFLFFVSSVTAYNELAKDLIWRLKSSGAQEAANIMATGMAKLIPRDNEFLIVPLPTATSRVRQRGYDQSKLIARQIAKNTRLPYLNCLARSGQAHQVGAGREQRLKQLENAFRIKRPNLIRRANIILVDDVVTTGATLEIVAKLLKDNGASSIRAITFAQPLMRNKNAPTLS